MKWPKIKIKLSFYLLLFLTLINEKLNSLLVILTVILIHELGHIIMIKLKKGMIYEISLGAIGANIKTNCDNSQLVNFGRHLM